MTTKVEALIQIAKLIADLDDESLAKRIVDLELWRSEVDGVWPTVEEENNGTS